MLRNTRDLIKNLNTQGFISFFVNVVNLFNSSQNKQLKKKKKTEKLTSNMEL